MIKDIKNRYQNSYMSYALMYFSYFFAMGMFGSILSLYLAGKGQSSAEISFVVSASGIFTMVLQPVVGAVYDYLQKDYVVSIVLLILSGIFGVLFVFTQNINLLFLLNGLSMSFLSGVNPLCEKIATASPFRYGMIRLWGAVGYASATLTSGFVYDYLFPGSNFFIFGAAILMTIAGFYGIRESKDSKGLKEEVKLESTQKSDSSRNKERKSILKPLLKNKAFLLFVIMSFLFSGSASASGTYLPLLLKQLFGSVTSTGTVLFLGSLMEIPIIISSHKYMDQLSNKSLVCIDFALLVIQFVCYTFFPLTWLVCIVILLCKSTATMLFIMVTLKVVLNLVEEHTTTTALSIVATVKAVGGVTITYLCGFSADWFGINAVFLILLLFSIVGLILELFAYIPSKKQKLF